MKRFIPLLALLACSAGCAGDSAITAPSNDPIRARQIPAALAPRASALVQANNRFALEAYARLRATPGNLFFSPFSISTAFAMAYAGAAGGTRGEMSQVFHYPADSADVNPAYAALLASLDRGESFGGYQLNIANGIWPQKDFAFLPEYLATQKDVFRAESQLMDFVAGAEAARASINAWVAGKTAQKIPELFGPGSINGDTRLVLANAVYFKGLWARQFEKSKTAAAPFHVEPATIRMVPTMNMEDTLGFAMVPYEPTQGVFVLELPYKGRDLSMLLVLPGGQDALGELEAGLTPERLEGWRSAVRVSRVFVSLPRFTFKTQIELIPFLKGMGMPAAFDPQQADFSGMDGRRDLSIGAAVHQAFVLVDEEGTEAAAATGIGMTVTSAPPGFYANHPFLFLIRDNVTGSYLFMGRVTDPSVK